MLRTFDMFFRPGDLTARRDISLLGEVTLAPLRRRADTARLGAVTGAAQDALEALPRAYTSEVDQVKPSPFAVLSRLVWLSLAVAYWFVAKVTDAMFRDWRLAGGGEGYGARRQAHLERQAVRLRRVLQRLGGTFVKVGQQLAIRTDVLPAAYCRQLELLLDRASPLDADFVHQTIERETGRRFDEIFERFDDEAIGQASIACVYRARLIGGAPVAVKIRRPRIVHIFKTDLAALGLVLRFFEFFTILRPGASETFRDELRKLLLEELDLRIEARYQELFRRYMREWKKLRVTAPVIYPALCTERLMVSELVDDAISARRMLEIIETRDAAGLELLAAMDIDPVKVARRLIRASQFQFFDCPFFHGDPHPANILVRAGSRIVMIDFGACGVFAETQRNYLRRMNYFQAREDIGGMVRCVIHLMEPLPPMELSGFQRDLEAAWWQGYYGIQSRHSAWWERTSFRLWTALLTTIQAYGIPLPLNVLRMIRATLLYDTVGARLDPRLDVFEEYRHYQRFVAKRTKRDVEQWMARQLVCGIDPMLFVRARQVVDVADGLLFEAQRFLGAPKPAFVALVGKAFSLAILFLRWGVASAIITLLALATLIVMRWDALWQKVAEDKGMALGAMGFGDLSLPDYVNAFTLLYADELARKGLGPGEWTLVIWAGLLGLLAMKYLRQAWFRLADKDSFL